MVQNLSLILVTSPELSDFRKRLKNLESKVGVYYYFFVTCLAFYRPPGFFSFPRTAKHSSPYSTGHGLITPSPRFRCVF
jgi:hypothetical protein